MEKILIVDDSKDTSAWLSHDLQDSGFQVDIVHSGEECLEYCRQNQPDLILLDLYMKGLSGIETLTHLKSDVLLQDIPVIMISASEQDRDVIAALSQGAHDFAQKPLQLPVLVARMQAALRLASALKEVETQNKKLIKLANTDELTGCCNRRRVFEVLSNEFERARRYGRDLSVLMIDIDHFKKINDQYGHHSGDATLIYACEIFQGLVRRSDTVARIGGEEFVICCPDTPREKALILAERIRERCLESELTNQNEKIQFTVSIGVTAQIEADLNYDCMLRRSDDLLYDAKIAGRNRVVSA